MAVEPKHPQDSSGEEVWARLEATPGSKDAMAQGIADLDAGRGITFPVDGRERMARLEADPEFHISIREATGRTDIQPPKE